MDTQVLVFLFHLTLLVLRSRFGSIEEWPHRVRSGAFFLRNFVLPVKYGQGWAPQVLGGGFKYFVCASRIPGEMMIQFDDHIFQMGW